MSTHSIIKTYTQCQEHQCVQVSKVGGHVREDGEALLNLAQKVTIHPQKEPNDAPSEQDDIPQTHLGKEVILLIKGEQLKL